MIIKETIERECCHTQDLKIYKGTLKDHSNRSVYKFCIHCGQLWMQDRQLYGGAGGTELVLVKVDVL